MKREVIRTFRDKHTKKRHVAGTVYEAGKDRVEELEEKGFLKPEDDPLEGNVKEVVGRITADTPDLNILLERENNGANRKTVIQHIEAVMKDESE